MATLSIYRDGADLMFGFDGNLPNGFAAFGHAGNNGRVWVRGVKGDKVPALVAADFLRDSGVEVVGAEKLSR